MSIKTMKFIMKTSLPCHISAGRTVWGETCWPGEIMLVQTNLGIAYFYQWTILNNYGKFLKLKKKLGSQFMLLLYYCLIFLQIMAPRKKLTREERLQKKREPESLRYKKIKNDPENMNCKSKKKRKNV